ncbi:hypothetical protein D3C73_1132700 [compost metagenome]
MQQGFVQQCSFRRLLEPFIAGEPRAHDRADTFAGQLKNLHVRRPGWLGKYEQGIQPRSSRIQIAFSGRQVQAQVRQVGIESPQSWNKPARQQTSRATEHEWRIGGALCEFGANAAQALEGFAAGVTQA